MRAGGGHARIDGPAVRAHQGRAGLLDHHRGLHPRRHHRHRGGTGHRHGADHPAGDDALQVRHALRDRRAGRVGHDHAARAALAGADRAGRPARPLGGRHVSRRLGPLAAADRPVRRLHLLRDTGEAGGPAAGAADAVRQGAPGQVRLGHHPRRRADLPRAGHHHDGPGDADGSGRDGHDRRDRTGGGAQRTADQVRPHRIRRRLRRCHHRGPDRHGRLQVDALQGGLHRRCSPPSSGCAGGRGR